MAFENEKLIELLNCLCNETITEVQLRELESILVESGEARELYLDYIQIQLKMVDRAKKSEVLAQSPLLGDVTGLNQQSTGSLGNSTFLTLIAGSLVIFGAIFLVAFLWPPGSFVDSAKGTSVAVKEATRETADSDLTSVFVAQVVGATPDVEWTDRSVTPDFLLRLRLGDRIEIESGFVELEYYTNARVILHGPSSFVLTGHNSGRLLKGKMTGRVDGDDFVVTTPSARIVDLGTEFGLEVTGASDTEVCVLDGKVEVFSDMLSGSDPLSLTQGMSARVEQNGTIDRSTDIDLAQYSYSLPNKLRANPNELSLVDLLSANSPDRFRLSGVIAPDTGKADQSPWLREAGPGHRSSDRYIETVWHPFVDGVFIPSRSGAGIQIDSSGELIDLPASMGRTWGPVWSRRKYEGRSNLMTHDSYWGGQTNQSVMDRLKDCESGMIGIHSNVGVTFDLAAVREIGFLPVELIFAAGNLDNSMEVSPEWSKKNRFTADLRVFVDGELRAQRLDFGRVDGELEISLALNHDDRFVTFVSSDCGRDGFDHVVIIDPKLLSNDND